ncbi:hypothetical protein IFR05_013842 [Cadophora sp. M221]|nr:hypothetical protein IFR05_013842 [Cadophora sp. M221]
MEKINKIRIKQQLGFQLSDAPTLNAEATANLFDNSVHHAYAANPQSTTDLYSNSLHHHQTSHSMENLHTTAPCEGHTGFHMADGRQSSWAGVEDGFETDAQPAAYSSGTGMSRHSRSMKIQSTSSFNSEILNPYIPRKSPNSANGTQTDGISAHPNSPIHPGRAEVSSKNMALYDSAGPFIQASHVNRSVNLASSPDSAGTTPLLPFGNPSLLSFDQFATKWDCFKARRDMRLKNEVRGSPRPKSMTLGGLWLVGLANAICSPFSVPGLVSLSSASSGRARHLATRSIAHRTINLLYLIEIYGYLAVPGFDHGAVDVILKNQTPAMQRRSAARPEPPTQFYDNNAVWKRRHEQDS